MTLCEADFYNVSEFFLVLFDTQTLINRLGQFGMIGEINARKKFLCDFNDLGDIINFNYNSGDTYCMKKYGKYIFELDFVDLSGKMPYFEGRMKEYYLMNNVLDSKEEKVSFNVKLLKSKKHTMLGHISKAFK